MIRHKSFKRAEDLREFLKATVPSNAYYSSAYYERPEADMEEKEWLGADLIFDIDADHIPTPCAKIHDSWVCKSCGMVGKGVPPGACPACGEQRIDEKTWPCDVCLESAKKEMTKLINFLMNDLGLSPDDMKASFSGHRGYHLHVESEAIQTLDQIARKEIVDYIAGTGLETRFHGIEEASRWQSHAFAGPNLDDPGWRGRIARGTREFLLTATPEELRELGLKKTVIEGIVQKRETISQSWKGEGPWRTVRGVGVESWKKIALRGAEIQSAKIDTAVTTDIHRLIRLPNTLHGKTGLKKIEVPIVEIERFDPLKSAVAFKKDLITVQVSEAPQFRLGDEKYGAYRNAKVELPTAAALLLLCKGAAQIAEKKQHV